MKALRFSFGRLFAGIAVPAAIVVFLSLAFFAPSASAAGIPCKDQVAGIKFTLPSMNANQQVNLPSKAGDNTVCVEMLDDKESVALKLTGVPGRTYIAMGNLTPLSVSAGLTTTMLLSNGKEFNGSVLYASPYLPQVVLVAITDLAPGTTVFVGKEKGKIVPTVEIAEWQDIKIPGNITQLYAGTTVWNGNGVTITVTSGLAFTGDGTAVLPEIGKMAEYKTYVANETELKLTGTVPGQRFFLAVESGGLTKDSWLQKRVETKPSTAPVGGKCYDKVTLLEIPCGGGRSHRPGASWGR